MKARISLITLGVADLTRALIFYRDGLGLATDGIIGTEFNDGAAIFFDLQNGLKLGLYSRQRLALDAGVDFSPASAAISLAHNVASRDEVDQVMTQAQAAGACITQAAHDTFWGGYAAYFQDPDGHLWEIAWNPHWPIAD